MRFRRISLYAMALDIPRATIKNRMPFSRRVGHIADRLSTLIRALGGRRHIVTAEQAGGASFILDGL